MLYSYFLSHNIFAAKVEVKYYPGESLNNNTYDDQPTRSESSASVLGAAGAKGKCMLILESVKGNNRLTHQQMNRIENNQFFLLAEMPINQLTNL